MKSSSFREGLDDGNAATDFDFAKTFAGLARGDAATLVVLIGLA